jgi:membrane protease YdiL (CAAX protease family)
MPSWNQVTLLIVPWLLLATTYLTNQLLDCRFGKKTSYLGGFLFYWIIWCMLFPLTLLGPQTIVHLFRSIGSPFGQPWCLGAFCLIAPPLVAFVFIFPKALQRASFPIVLVSALLALINGPLEELLWRGGYISLFPGNHWLGLLYPSVGFALWHFAPMSIFPPSLKGLGGKIALVAQVWFLGLLWAWVANDTGVILWTSIAHILIDFSALGWDVLFI